ncbi:hypothetical protein Aperf_G00000119913 [Anoplocephala perfoliata]
MLDSQFVAFGGQIPPKCMPSPRTVARVASNNRPGGVGSTPFSLRRRFQRFETVPDNEELSNTKSTSPLSFTSSRSYPVVFPACDPPLCSDCRQFDARFPQSPGGTIATTANTEDDDSEAPDFSLLLDPDRPTTPDYSEEDIVRMLLTATSSSGSNNGGGRLRGAWWCDKCVALLSAPDVGIGQLFALLRQWTPSTQLQLDTIVMEILKRGAHVDDRDGMTDMTLLHYTAKSGALGNEELACRIAEFLLDHGACLEARSGWEDLTPLHFAAYFDCPQVLRLLLARGADPLVRSAALEGATPLHLAAAQLSLASARLLAPLPLAVASNGTSKGGMEDLNPLESPLMCKDALDAAMRTPYDCLPPAGELPEPLSSMRDRIAEILGPPVDKKTKLQLAFLGAGCSANSGYRVLPAVSQHLIQGHWGVETPSPIPHRSHSTAIPFSKDAPAASRSRSPGGSLLFGILAPACSADEIAAPMPAETGVLSPRRPRRATTASTEPNTPFASPARVCGPVNSLQPATQQLQVQPSLSLGASNTISATHHPHHHHHPMPSTSAVSAKVTLRAMGLALGDRVCVGPGGSEASSMSKSISPSSVATNGRMGRLRYCGPVEFASGVWVGIELDEAYGKNNGSVNGISYFDCEEKHGIFAPIGRVYKVSRTSGQVRPCFIEPNGGRRSTPTPLQNIPIDVSHVGAKVDTGLHKSSNSEEYALGDRVLVAGLRRGTIRYIGETQFAPGIWYGVELSKAVGKNDGSVEGVRYFTCEPKHGVFAPASRLQKLPPRNKSALLAASNDMSQSVHADFLPDCQRRRPATPEYPRRLVDNYASLGRPRPSTASSKSSVSIYSNGDSTRRRSSVTGEEFYLQVGMQVLCTGELGTLRYIGPVDFTDGLWLGVELRGPHGRHDGAVAGRRYFTCSPNHGVLVRPSRVTFRGINAAKMLPPGLVAAFEKRPSSAKQPSDTRSIMSHP